MSLIAFMMVAVSFCRYAGMYISGLAHFIHQQNKKALEANKSSSKSIKSSWQPIRLSGIAMGNAWIDATIQGPAVIDYAWWHGMIDSVMRDALQVEWKHCYNSNDYKTTRRQQPPGFHPLTVPDECGIMSVLMEAAGANLFSWGSPNVYDVSTWDKYDLIISNNSTIDDFFNRPVVLIVLNGLAWRGTPMIGMIPIRKTGACVDGPGLSRWIFKGTATILTFAEVYNNSGHLVPMNQTEGGSGSSGTIFCKTNRLSIVSFLRVVQPIGRRPTRRSHGYAAH